MKNYLLNQSELVYAKAPFSYEFIKARQSGKWRICDKNDNAVGSAEDEASAIEAIKQLNVKTERK